MKKILLLGGSGFVGRHVCAALARQGHSVTILTRRRTSARELQVWPTVTVHEIDVMRDASWSVWVRGHDAVVNLIAVLHGDEGHFESVHVQWPQRVAQACLQHGGCDLIHISALGADPQGPSMYLRSKGRGEQALQQVALDGGMKLTLIRPSVIFGKDDRFINLFARLQKWTPFVPLAGASAKFQPVWVQDVARSVARVALDSRLQNQHYELGGPQVLNLADLVRHAGRWAGCPRPVLPLPATVAWAQAALMEWMPGDPLMSRDNLASMQVDNVLSGQCPGLAELGLGQGTGLQSVFNA